MPTITSHWSSCTSTVSVDTVANVDDERKLAVADSMSFNAGRYQYKRRAELSTTTLPGAMGSHKPSHNCLLFVCLALTIAWQCSDIAVEASQQEKQLYNLLMQGYSKQTRPVRRVDDAITVRVALSLVEVLSIDENNGQIAVKAWLTSTWRDEYLTWNPDLHGGIKRLNFATGPGGRIWTPDILIFNALKTEIDNNVQAVVYFDGSVTWVQPAVYTVRCRHEFRGNSWVAGFQLGSWTYDDRLLDIQPLPVGGKSSANNPPAAAAAAAAYGSNQHQQNTAATVVDLDVESYMTNDHWALLDHTGRREARTAVCCDNTVLPTASGNDVYGQSETTFEAPTYVSMHYLLKLRKKLGPSLLGKRRRR